MFGVAATSAVVNGLALTGSFFMLQVYDRVIPGRSFPTLVGLALVAATLYIFQGLLELVRSMLLLRVGLSVDEKFGRDVYQSLVLLPSRMQMPGDGMQSVRDMDTVRAFLSGPGPTALFDIPWMPFYLGLCFLFHPWIGVTALCGAMVLIGLTMLAEYKSRQPAKDAARIAAERNALGEATRRNSEAVLAMGFAGQIADKWNDVNQRYLANNLRASHVTGVIATTSKIVRMMLQSAVLAVGAILVIRQEATGGIMIASSILVSRALAPVELAVSQWKGFSAARDSWARLIKLSQLLHANERHVALPKPTATLQVENLQLVPPGGKMPVVRGVSYQLHAGEALGVIGPSASGKSSLVRGLVGLWQPAGGKVRLDGASLSQWDPQALGKSIGYLPQEVSLFAGTIAENIARFDANAPSDKIISAARAAGVYELIVRLPDGFDTLLGEWGMTLSSGQRQRIALARALYDDPFLVILDEPNSNLDGEGDIALTDAILGVKARGGVVVVVAHRPSALIGVDKVMVMASGQLQAFGPKEEILERSLKRSATPPTSPVRLIASTEDAAK